jgi:hypothetical protein
MARYFRRGTSKMYFAPTIADISAPTEAEMLAGTDLSCEVGEIEGFKFSNNPIDVPDFCSEFVSKIPGEDTGDDSSMTFYEDDTSNPIQALLAKGTEAYIVLFPYGISATDPQAGDECEVWPVSVASNTREWSAGNDPARYMVEFTLSAPPDTSAVVA